MMEEAEAAAVAEAMAEAAALFSSSLPHWLSSAPQVPEQRPAVAAFKAEDKSPEPACPPSSSELSAVAAPEDDGVEAEEEEEAEATWASRSRQPRRYEVWESVGCGGGDCSGR